VKCVGSLCLIAISFAVAGLSPAFPQASSTTADLRGTITDPSGRVVPGARVVLTDTAKGIKRSTVTDAKEEYTFLEALPSTYTLSVEPSGFALAKSLSKYPTYGYIAAGDLFSMH
jgi:hypothetical protein